MEDGTPLDGRRPLQPPVDGHGSESPVRVRVTEVPSSQPVVHTGRVAPAERHDVVTRPGLGGAVVRVPVQVTRVPPRLAVSSTP